MKSTTVPALARIVSGLASKVPVLVRKEPDLVRKVPTLARRVPALARIVSVGGWWGLEGAGQDVSALAKKVPALVRKEPDLVRKVPTLGRKESALARKDSAGTGHESARTDQESASTGQQCGLVSMDYFIHHDHVTCSSVQWSVWSRQPLTSGERDGSGSRDLDITHPTANYLQQFAYVNTVGNCCNNLATVAKTLRGMSIAQTTCRVNSVSLCFCATELSVTQRHLSEIFFQEL
ncbi:hypothetical protein J6590_019121 [Homalodisca vitripennis]|nr:hypothetical protein J6590_019121 [Homalodisca vitripennis]